MFIINTNTDLDLWKNEVECCKKVSNNRNAFNKKSIEIKINNNSENSFEHNKFEYFGNLNRNLNKNELSNDFELTLNNSLGIDNGTDKKLQLGKYKIDKIVDFHGLTINSAFDLFIDSINQAYRKKLRCILFITGKGINSVNKYDTIKENFQKWIKIDFICNKVVKYTYAAQKDGGTGAFYVLLKKNNSKDDCYIN